MANEKEAGSVHKGHRQRVKQMIKEHGIDTLNEHQILEALLFYGIANGDTNPVAHRLIDRFGSLKNVIDADFDELCEVSGIGENSALLIYFIREIISKYLMDSCYDPKSMRFVSTDALRQYFEALYIGSKTEKLYALALDDDLRLIKLSEINEGSPNQVLMRPRLIVDFVVKCNCSSVVIAHNHPNGLRLASKEDVTLTIELYDLLASLDVILVDHIIVGKDGALSLRCSNHASMIWGDTSEWD